MAALATSTCALSVSASASLLPCKLTSRRSSQRSFVSVTSTCRKVSSRWTMSAPKELEEKIVQGIKDAETVCADPKQTEECAVAWDEVEELSAAAADKTLKNKQPSVSDPLEVFCAENPETDECRVYEE